MIVRILNEGQWELDDSAMPDLNALDEAVEHAVGAGDQDQLAVALHALLKQVRSVGTPVPDEALRDSDLILPDADATLADVQDLLSESDSGLIPG